MASKAQKAFGAWGDVKRFNSLTAASLFLGCGLIAGCIGTGGSSYGLQDEPAITVLVDDVKLADNVCAHFATDDTNGVIKQSKKVTITNSGANGTLCINKITFTPTSTKLMTIAYGGHTADLTKCPAAFASLEPGKSMIATITYAPAPGLTDKVKLSIEHNDKDPTKYNNMCFDVSAQGPVISVKQTSLVFINPKASGGLQQCVYFGNDGGAALVITKVAEFQPNSPEYKIVSQPNVGDQISALGSADNQPSNPKTLPICIVMSSDGNPDNDQVQLVIHTNDLITPDATVKVFSKFEATSSYTVTCQGSDPTVIEYNFQGAGQGVERTCNVHNDGPSPWAWNNVPQIVAIAPSTQDDVDLVYKLKLMRNGKERAQSSYGAGSVAVGQSIDYTIVYTPPTNGQPPPSAKLVVSYSQTPLPPAKLEIPILSASCDLPTLVFAPAQLWFYATMNNKAQAHIAFANQSCAPLDILKACINTNNPSGADPCASVQFQSKYYSLLTPVGASQITPSTVGGGNGLLGLDVQFMPTDDLHINDLALLNIVYCITGSVAANDCKAGYQTINLTGNTTAGVTLPSAALSVETATPASGKPCVISGVLTPGSFPDAHSWEWQLIERPPGSKSWIGDENQSTPDPSMSFVPDAKGKYTIQGMALTTDPSDPAQLAWTVPATVSFTIP